MVQDNIHILFHFSCQRLQSNPIQSLLQNLMCPQSPVAVKIDINTQQILLYACKSEKKNYDAKLQRGNKEDLNCTIRNGCQQQIASIHVFKVVLKPINSDSYNNMCRKDEFLVFCQKVFLQQKNKRLIELFSTKVEFFRKWIQFCHK